MVCCCKTSQNWSATIKLYCEWAEAVNTIPDKAGFQNISFELPTQANTATVRLYLPANKGAGYEIKSLKFTNTTGLEQTWDFTK